MTAEPGRGGCRHNRDEWPEPCLPWAAELRERAKSDGIAPRTLDRAKAALGVEARRIGFGEAGQWVWALPKSAKSAIERQPLGLAHNGKVGAL
jgi:hypothetical protein